MRGVDCPPATRPLEHRLTGRAGAGHPSLMRKIVALVAVLVSLPFACGHIPEIQLCQDEYCVSPSEKSWCGTKEACPEGTRCIQNLRSIGTTYAACAIGEIDPDCNRDKDVQFCKDNTRVRCHGRYREEAVDCGDLFCVEVDARAVCVRSREPDPNCDADGGPWWQFCEGNSLVRCFGPFAGPPKDCAGGDARFCRGVAGAAACRLQPEPDPRCAGRKPGDDRFCDGDVAVACEDGWRARELDCAKEGKRCEEILEVGSNDPHVRCQW